MPDDAVQMAHAILKALDWSGGNSERNERTIVALLSETEKPESSTCPENMLPCDMGCTGGWCVTLFGGPAIRNGNNQSGSGK